MKSEKTTFIKQKAREVGFDACGVAKAERLTDDAQILTQWLEEGKQGEMSYLERNFEKRIDPTQLVAGCKSVVVVLMNYYPSEEQKDTRIKLSKYAQTSYDYHFELKERLGLLEKEIVKQYGENSVNTKQQHRFVDSAPILERRWAERAGLGWIGKNKMLIHPLLGSFVFIGVLLLNIELEYDTPIEERCGKCTRCIDACPTQALLASHSLDARKCISYQTIEKRGEVDSEIRQKLSGYIFGCDICQDVCPWNRKSKKRKAPICFSQHTFFERKDTEKWTTLTQGDFNAIFKKTALERAGYEKIKQNITYVKENCK